MSLFDPQGLVWKLATLLVVGLLFTAVPATAQDADPNVSPFMVPNPSTELWEAVRQRGGPSVGSTQIRGVDSGVLIQKSGEDFRNYRRDDFIRIGAMVLGGVLVILAAFFLTRGKMRLPHGRSGRLILRFGGFDRMVHWLLTGLFIVLALTGLLMLFGRFVVLPWMGADAFSAIAGVSKFVHDYISPLFLIAVLLLFVRYVSKNIPTLTDIKWLLRAGGMIGKGHPSAGFFNGGEKVWFWLVIALGVIVSASGLVLLFPIFDQGREIMQIALVVHGAAAVVFIAISFGHMYMATIGTEGTQESMMTGYVDESWAEVHHDLWLAEVKQQAQGEPAARPATEPPSMQSSPDRA